jgi:hypothetical protein
MVLFRRATGTVQEAAAQLASIAEHESLVRGTVLLTLAQFLCAIILGVTLYALTRDEDRDIALLALCCRATEGVVGAVAAIRTLELLAVAKASIAATGLEAAGAQALGASLLDRGGGTVLVASTCFALGSTLYSYLFLRARSIPLWMAWLGVVASAMLALVLPLRVAGVIHGPVIYYVWIPMAVFEVTFALWLLIKGVAVRTRHQAA